jgi:hypothetical protein
MGSPLTHARRFPAHRSRHQIDGERVPFFIEGRRDGADCLGAEIALLDLP